ncbi:MAG: tetraacyldisaccharide 4'-kinase [Phycisphaeraceae bacterium]|nr:tetraacyldisaccharide 4'-kinase [Phycisphaeraceae bacterium]
MTTTPINPSAPRRGPLPGLLGRAAARVYALGIARHNRRYDAGRGVNTLSVPVISIGNLSVGGTGKTPMVAHICRVLLERGIRPCIAMRGYAPGRRGGAGQESDEADAYARLFDDAVDIISRPDRYAGIQELLAERSSIGRDAAEREPPPAPGAVVLDDGFQHRQIARDLDIVLIDASRSPFQDRLLPAGWLREPVESLQRASCVVVTHAELAKPDALHALERDIHRAHGRPPIAVTRHLWTALRDADDMPRPLDALAGRRVLGVCAIGNPAGFEHALRATVGAAGPAPEVIVLPDHDAYAATTINRIADAARRIDAEFIITTDKDWSKLRNIPRGKWPCPVARPELSLSFLSGREELEGTVIDAASPR